MFHFHAIVEVLILVFAVAAVLPFSNVALLEQPTIVDHAAEVLAEDGRHVLHQEIFLGRVHVHIGIITHALMIEGFGMLI